MARDLCRLALLVAILGLAACGGGRSNAGPSPCVPTPEVCDGIDNDCNGLVDDGLGTISCGVGACQRTVAACTNGVAGACVAGTPSPEVCDGIDNDCNGLVDEGNPGGGASCSTGQAGVCAAGTTACQGGAIACVRNVAPTAEVCGDGLDNDCNGQVDEGCCAPGSQRCQGNVLQTCSGGAFQDAQTCAAVCDAALGCVACAPSTTACVGDVSRTCGADGAIVADVACDPLQGMSCGPSGRCEGPCSPDLVGQSYLGCDFRPTVTGNPVASAYHFAVAVANPGAAAVTVTVDGAGLLLPVTFTVPAGGASVQPLPWVASLKLCTATTAAACAGTQANAALAVGGSYRLRATGPVAVVQHNPVEYAIAGAADALSSSNDASLLLPVTAWGRSHYVASWAPLSGSLPGLLTVTAAQDGTSVTLTAAAATPAAGGAPAFAAQVAQTVTLGAGDTLELGSVAGDLTGSHVVADKPVQVLGGHYCAQVPDGVPFCDHLEETMPPVEALGRRYLVAAPGTPSVASGREQVIRIVATQDGTGLTYDPALSGAPTSISSAGGFVTIPRQAATFQVTGDKKILVVQYMEGGQATAIDEGDPSLSFAVPVEQYRTSYRFHAPTTYATTYLDVLAPAGATISLDGAVLTGFTAIGSSGYGLARVRPLGAGPGGDGFHAISGDLPFGISVYGYGTGTSYWYPGGLDAAAIP